MARYWPGRSLLQLHTGELSWREVRVFIEHLPPDSATGRSMRGSTPEDDAWTLDRQLLAIIADSVRESTFMQVKLHGDPKKTKRLQPPEPIQRPGVEARSKKSNVIKFGGRHGSGAAQLATVFGGASG